MIYAKILRNRNTVVVEGGSAYLFDIGGVCIGESLPLLPEYMDSLVCFEIISIVSSGERVEVALFSEAGLRKKYLSELDSVMCGMFIQKEGGYLRVLRRSGKLEDVRYNQVLFLYRNGTDLMDKLKNLRIKECTE